MGGPVRKHKWLAAAAVVLAGCTSNPANSVSERDPNDAAGSTDAPSVTEPQASPIRPGDTVLDTSAAQRSLEVLLAAWVASQPREEPNEGLDGCPLFDAKSFAAQAPAAYSPPAAKTILGVAGHIDKDGPALSCIGGSEEVGAGVWVLAAPPLPFESHLVEYLVGDGEEVAFGEIADFGGGTLHAFSFTRSGSNEGATLGSAWIAGDLEILLLVEGGLESSADASAWLAGLLPIVISGVERATPENTLTLDTDDSEVPGSAPAPAESSDLETAAAARVVHEIVGDGEPRDLTSVCPMGEPSELLAAAPADFAVPSQIGDVSNWINDGDPTIGCSVKDGAEPGQWRVRFIVGETNMNTEHLGEYETAADVQGGDLYILCEQYQCKVVWQDVNLTVKLYADGYTVTSDLAIEYLAGALPGIVERLSNIDPADVTLGN